MSNAYRSHYQPAAQELIPGADPYILSLVQAVCRPATSRGATDRHLERHCEGLRASFDRSEDAFEISPPLGSDCPQTRVDRRCAPRRLATASRRVKRGPQFEVESKSV